MQKEQVFLVEYIGQVYKKNVCIVSPLNLKRRIIFKAKKLPTVSGLALRAFGNFNNEGNVFFADEWQVEMLPEKSVFLAYAKTFPHIGTKKAQQIYDTFGADYSVFLSEEKMRPFSKHCKEIVAFAQENAKRQMDTRLLDKLSTFGVIPNGKIPLIAKTVSYEAFEENPFILMDVKGAKTGFRICNSIVLQMQKSEPKYLVSQERLNKGVEYVLRQSLKQRGDTYITADRLIYNSLKFLNEGVVRKKNLVTPESIKRTINVLRKEHILKAEKTADGELRFYEAFYYDCENFIADEVYRLMNKKPPKTQKARLQKIIGEFEQTTNFNLADSQKLAVETIANSNLAVITGSAGTGKTTVLRAALFTLKQLGVKKITLAAPTGRAARRMTESTGHPASTLHSLLHLGIEEEDVDLVDVYVSDDKIDTEVIFIDETSMCDISIIYRLFQKLPPNARVFFIGDPEQLESVGSGNVLHDFIESCCLPVIKLKFIYRQAKDSKIILNAQKILENNDKLLTGSDFEIINQSEPEKVQAEIAKIYKRLYNPNDILTVQCICPARRVGLLASNQLNKVVQEAVNPHSTGSEVPFKANGFKFFVNDKIICSKNTDTIKNGDMGIVTAVTSVTMTAMFDTGEEVFNYDRATELGIILAYCISVHKAQGSEFDTTIMPIVEENKSMLKKNLFYTAVTRAKKKMILVGQPEQISSAIRNNKVSQRNGNLKNRIKRKFKTG